MSVVGRLDAILGTFLRLQHPALHAERLLSSAVGRYTPEEWTLARRLGYGGAGLERAALSSDVAYIRRLVSHPTQVRNIVSAHRLVELFDLAAYGSLLEIGCGEMAQALVLKELLPDLRYEATDLDPFVIAKISQLSLLKKISAAILDARSLTVERLPGYRLVLSWQLIYAPSRKPSCAVFWGYAVRRGWSFSPARVKSRARWRTAAAASSTRC